MQEKLIGKISDEVERRRKEWEIASLREELDVLRWRRSEGAKYRIITIVRILCLLGARKFDLDFCYLKGARFDKVELKGASFSGANCEGALLNGMDLRKVNFLKANLRKARLWNSDLSGAGMSDADLREAEMNGTIVEGASLYGTDLRGARDLTFEQLSKARTLFRAKLDQELFDQIKEKRPILLKDPDFV